MRRAAIVLILVSFVSTAAGAEAWLREWPPTSGEVLPSNRIFEIPHSLYSDAEALLSEKAAILLGNNYFPGVHFVCPKSTGAYLVRALYEHPSNGIFEVRRSASVLLIRHFALGGKSELHRSALIVCLDFVPTDVFVGVHGAM